MKSADTYALLPHRLIVVHLKQLKQLLIYLVIMRCVERDNAVYGKFLPNALEHADSGTPVATRNLFRSKLIN